jgi:hypothetical protein
VLDARDAYVTAKREAAKAAEAKGGAEQDLIKEMHEAGIERLQLDDENKYIEINAPEKVSIKTVPKEQREKREAAET